MNKPQNSYKVSFRRLFYIVTAIIGTVLGVGGTLLFGNLVVGYVIVGAFIVGTSNGMVWGAERVIDREEQCH